ncbi:unnamed protein product [Calicophoron daubneyi]|uniref:non-specific serine/threonine protein kinase n=1 Tax=Calicophoron daubneyi TaxID=300641 RepID=A0AAV2TDZ5_CALDB
MDESGTESREHQKGETSLVLKRVAPKNNLVNYSGGEKNWFNASLMQPKHKVFTDHTSATGDTSSVVLGQEFTELALEAMRPDNRVISRGRISQTTLSGCAINSMQQQDVQSNRGSRTLVRRSSVSRRQTTSNHLKINVAPRPHSFAPSENFIPYCPGTSSSLMGLKRNTSAEVFGSTKSTDQHRGNTSSTFSPPPRSELLSRAAVSSNASSVSGQEQKPPTINRCRMKLAPSCPFNLAQAPQSSEYQRLNDYTNRVGGNTTQKHSLFQELRDSIPDSLGFYQVQEVIGAGNFSQVKLATHILTKELVAIKVLDKTRMDASTRRLLSREISILETVHHPNIVRLYEVIETLTRLHLVMEYVAGGDLNKRISTFGKFSEPEAKIIFSQLVAAVNHLHERNIFHRDIKADNILFTKSVLPPEKSSTRSEVNICELQAGNHKKLNRHVRRWFRSRAKDEVLKKRSTSEISELSTSNARDSNDCLAGHSTDRLMNRRQLLKSRWESEHSELNKRLGEAGTKNLENRLERYRIKLADFGFSKLTATQNQPLTTFCGSPAYAAPELFEAQSYQGGPVDIWALGIVLFFLLTGLLPYRGATVGQVKQLVLQDRGLKPPDWLSLQARDLYTHLTSRKPGNRPTVAELIKYAKERKNPCSGDNASPSFKDWRFWLAGCHFPKPLPRFNRYMSLHSSTSRKLPETNIGPSTLNRPGSRPVKQSEHLPQNVSPAIDRESMKAGSNFSTSSDDFNSLNNTPVHESAVSDSSNASNKKTCQSTAPPDASSLGVQIAGEKNEDAEAEATRRIMELGITREELEASKMLEARSSIVGAYRIMLHRAHRKRRLSELTSSVSDPCGKAPVVDPQNAGNPTQLNSVEEVRVRSQSLNRGVNIKRSNEGNRKTLRGKRLKPSRMCALL